MSLQQQKLPSPPPLPALNLSSQFDNIRDSSPTIRQIQDLQNSIDRECLAHSDHNNGADPTLSSGTVVQITPYLSSPLVQWRGADSDLFWEVQLRALIAALALLLHIGVTELTAEPHDQLRRNIAGRFNHVVNISTSSLEDRMSKANAHYLVRLAAQYFWLFKRAQPLPDALPLPILGLVMAGVSMAGGQYNGLRSIFQYADEVIGLIPGRRSRHLNLPAIQEITRRATTLMKTADHADLDVKGDANLVQELLNAHFQTIPSRKVDPWNWPLARLRLGPPSMNKWYFFYGLLDCAAQVARHLEPEQMSPELLENLRQLMAESEFEEFRWKVREIFPAVEGPRLRQNSEQQAGFHALMRAQTSSGRSSEMTSAPSIPVGLSPATTVSSDEIQPCPQQHDPVPTESSNEASPVHYIEESLSCWEQDGEPQVRRLLPTRGIFKSSIQRGFSHAGLSPDCSLTFFYSPTKVCLYPTSAADHGAPSKGPILEQKYRKDDLVVDVSLSKSLLAVSTCKKLELHWIGAGSPKLNTEVLHGDWLPSGLALHERLSHILVAVGHCGQADGARAGKVTLYDVRRSSDGAVRAKATRIYKLPDRDFPRSLLFDGQGESLTCVTDIKNMVVVWSSVDPKQVVIIRCHHKPETGSEGVTSAVLYTSPSQQSYVLCSTSASTERYRSNGEWPFISPVATSDEEVPPSTVHDFVALQSYRQLITGAVSSVANIYAVLEKTGKIVTLRLTSHEHGGIGPREEAPQKLRASLCSLESSRASTTCMRFDPSGEKLYAVDPEGKLLVVTFKPED